MAQEQQDGFNQQNSNSLEQPSKGLYTDTAPINQPQGTYRYALNAVNESNEGDIGTLSNELSNKLYAVLPKGYIPIGSVYIGDGELCIFSTNGTNSEIGILSEKMSYDNEDINNNYVTVVNDTDSKTKDKFNFRIDKQIQAVYRLRRGCDKMIYWTDNFNVPRSINLNKLSNYKDITGKFTAGKTGLIKTTSSIPTIDLVKVNDKGGNLEPGSYNVLIQLLDEQKNATKYLSETGNINIYKSSIYDKYNDIDGSINKNLGEEYTKKDGSKDKVFSFGKTNKSITIQVSNISSEYPYYRLAFVHYTNAEGKVSGVYLSDLISSKQNIFTYDGNNHKEKEDINHIETFNRSVQIATAKSVLIDDNRLVLSNVKGVSDNFINLQKYASKIAVDCITKDIQMSDIREINNPKNPLVGVEGMQFLPGEVYSLGIVYVFEDGTESPVFHIPGKISEEDLPGVKNKVYNTENFYTGLPMSNDNNWNNNLTYSVINNCDNSDYWGYDCNGIPLEGKRVRFHRFPTRDALNGFFDVRFVTDTKKASYFVKLKIKNISKDKCKECLEGTDKDLFKNICIKVDNEVIVNSYSLSIEYESIKNDVRTLDTKNIKIDENTLENEMYLDSIAGDFSSFSIKKIEKKTLIAFEKKEEIYEFENDTLGALKSVKYKVEDNGVATEGVGDQKHIIDPRLEEITEDWGKRTEEVNEALKEKKITSYWAVYDKEILQKTSELDTPVENKKEIVYSEKVKDILKHEFTFVLQESELTNSQMLGSYKLCGINLSNIELPSEQVIGKKCIGYYVVKQDRKEKDKTVLGTAVGYRTWGSVSNVNESINKVSCAHFNYSFMNGGDKYSSTCVPYDNAMSIISPEHLFEGKTFDEATNFKEIGVYSIKDDFSYSGVQIQDVDSKKPFSSAEGTSDLNSATKDDPKDGVTLRMLIKTFKVKYQNKLVNRTNKNYEKSNIDIFDLRPLSKAKIPNNKGLLFNMDMNSRRLILYSNKLNFNTYTQDTLANKGHESQDEYKHSKNNVYPYLLIQKNHNNFYSDYREAPYYRLDKNIQVFPSYNSFNGDGFIGSLRPSSMTFLNMILALRVKQYSFNKALKIIIGFIIAAVVTIATLGAGAGVAAAIVTGVLLTAGAIYNGVYEQVKLDEFNDAYDKYWFEGLFNSVRDDLIDEFFLILKREPGYSTVREVGNSWVNRQLGIKPSVGKTVHSPKVANSMTSTIDNGGGASGFTDDVFAWNCQAIQDLFFDTEVNIALRNSFADEDMNYLRPQSFSMFDYRYKIQHNESLMQVHNFDNDEDFFSAVDSNTLGRTFAQLSFGPIYDLFTPVKRGVYYVFIDDRPAVRITADTEKYFVKKICEIDESYVAPEGRKGKSKEELLDTWGEHGYMYKYLATPEFYFVNKDYNVKEKLLKHYTIPTEYDFCSDCNESFPQRFYWSEVGLSEELVDNYKIFKPNNYKDLSGEYGNITNSFTFNNKLYFHTEEALWYQPTNIQERVTNGIVSYLGTGEYGSLPAQLIVDDRNGNSAGLQHREACVLTPYGYFFVSEREQKVYKFDGKLTPISDIGISNWFDNNITINLDRLYKGINGEEYAYRDNPSNKYGTGFLMSYDKDKERILLTKKDFLFLLDELNSKDVYVIIDKGKYIYYIKDFKKNNKSLKSSLVTDYKKSLIDSMLFTDSNGGVLRVTIPYNTKFKYEGIRNKRAAYSAWIRIEDKNFLIYGFVKATAITENINTTNLSYTVSFSLKNNTWTSFHSYLPNFYARMNDSMFSYSLGQDEKNGLYIHSQEGNYQTFYGKLYPYIVESVNNDNLLITKIFNHLRVITEAYKYDKDSKSFYEQRYVTFNKAMFYNTRQCSGVLNLFVKNTSVEEDYLIEQVQNLNNGTIIIDRNEKDWLMNDIRDYVVRYDKAIFNENRKTFTGEQEFIDKRVNDGIIDLEKDWYNLENFRDKFLVVRLIFDNFAEENKNTKLVLFITSENNNVSNY